MDRGQFDALARLVSSRRSRRAALAALASAALLPGRPVPPFAKAKGKKKPKRRPCYPTRGCFPGQGRDNAGCDFTNSTLFYQREVQGSNLSNANLTGAQLAEANLQGVDLGGSCLVSANLQDAVVDGSTKFKGAIFCNTVMPDSSINNSGCDRGTRCCPTPGRCQGDACAGDDCSTSNAICSTVIPPPVIRPCCLGWGCTPTITIAFFNCQFPCKTDADCVAKFGQGVCDKDPVVCPLMKCCTGTGG